MAQDVLFDYAAEVLTFGFAGDLGPAPVPAAPAADALERMAGRCRAAFERSGKARLVLLGLGSGALAAALAASLPEGALCVCEQDLPLARALHADGRLAWWERFGPARLAADSSPWALLLLLDRAGIAPDEALVLPNPELAPRAKAALRSLELLLLRSRPAIFPPASRVPKLSAAAILSPTEPDLPEFFAQFPDWIHELVLVWDAETLPRVAVPERFTVWQTARPLARDFSAQRNVMLSACTGEWVFFLDADERLAPPAWNLLPALCAPDEVAGWHFPRVSPYPTQERAVVGFGLWPDVQLRLFRRGPQLAFVNPVHERLTGLCGAQGLVLNLEIEHLSRLRKDAESQRRKLAGFDDAGRGGVRHVLSAEYPSLPRRLLEPADPGGILGGAPRGLVLPGELG